MNNNTKKNEKKKQKRNKKKGASWWAMLGVSCSLDVTSWLTAPCQSTERHHSFAAFWCFFLFKASSLVLDVFLDTVPKGLLNSCDLSKIWKLQMLSSRCLFAVSPAVLPWCQVAFNVRSGSFFRLSQLPFFWWNLHLLFMSNTVSWDDHSIHSQFTLNSFN